MYLQVDLGELRLPVCAQSHREATGIWSICQTLKSSVLFKDLRRLRQRIEAARMDTLGTR